MDYPLAASALTLTFNHNPNLSKI